MALPQYNQFSSPEQNVLDLLASQDGPNPPLGQEEFRVLITKAVLNLFQPAGGSLTETTADARYLRQSNNLSDVQNPLQALANIGGMPRNDFLTTLASLAAGIVVRLSNGTAVAREIGVLGDGLTVVNGDGQAGNPAISLSSRLQQVDGASLQDLWGFVYRAGQVSGMSLVGASFGGAPITIADGDSFEVIANTQCPFSTPINVDGELVVDGILYGV